MAVIIKLQNPESKQEYYLEWSTICDAPLTNGMTLLDFKSYYRGQYGDSGMNKLDDRLIRVEKTGTSGYVFDLETIIENNQFIKRRKAVV